MLEVRAQNQVGVPGQASPRPHVPSRRERVSWERMAATPDLAVYLAVQHLSEGEGAAQEHPVGTAAMVLMPHLT